MAATADPLDRLALFVAVADDASFSRAARRLGISKGTMSRAISRLEAELGAELLHRTTHKVALSVAGTALYERVAPHLIELRRALCRLPERTEQPSGELRITAPPDFGVMVLPEVIAQFALRYPQVHLDVRITNEAIDLVAERFDLAIRASTGRQSKSLLVRRLGAAELRYYASPAYVARRGEPRSIDVSEHDWIRFAPLERKQRRKKSAAPRCYSDDFFFIRELLRQGVGVGPLPSYLAEPYVTSGELVAMRNGLRFRSAGAYYLLSPMRRALPRKTAAFRDMLVEHLRVRRLDAG
jgi:DNA-binding transcriptional LysR family regulator